MTEYTPEHDTASATGKTAPNTLFTSQGVTAEAGAAPALSLTVDLKVHGIAVSKPQLSALQLS